MNRSWQATTSAGTFAVKQILLADHLAGQRLAVTDAWPGWVAVGHEQQAPVIYDA
jgi:hypothetical protein